VKRGEADRPFGNMPFADKLLYHQIHPLKLATDIAAAFGSLYPFWQHRLWLGLAVAVIPCVIASILVMRYADLEWLKGSAFGVYIGRSMTPAMQALRLAGFVVMALGAWFHTPLAILFGIVIVLAAWLKGALLG
jgi:hypothetical protein